MFWWREQVDEGLWVGFTDTTAGNLALHVGDDPGTVERRRRALESALGIGDGGLRFMNQVHSANVGTVRPMEPTEGPAELDALVAPAGDVPLGVMVADCLPVVFAADTGQGHATGVAHAGRRGLLDGVLVNTVRQWIGPAICGRCYEVPGAMRDEAAAVLPQLRSETSWGTPALDLPAGAAAQLASLGVAVQRIEGCTLEQPGLFSYRRDHATGRFAGLVWTEA
jgi:polyphenol oxidase